MKSVCHKIKSKIWSKTFMCVKDKISYEVYHEVNRSAYNPIDRYTGNMVSQGVTEVSNIE